MLENIHNPADLRRYALSELPNLAKELRQYLLDTVAQTGGHLSASLGTVEMTIALHHVFNTPYDRLVWDVGHQAYGHKVLTGRREALNTIRRKDGLAGFPKRSESEYDTFGVGHSSTSISAALGMALASAHKGEKRRHVAIIGDGAMTAGMAYEALHHAGDQEADLLVILNDNDMSISPNVGGVNRYLARLLSGQLYTRVRESGKRVLAPLPPMQEFARRAEEHMKGMVAPSTLFEEMGLHYFGPVDGHDVQELVRILRNIRDHSGPRLLHLVTKKGYGYSPAEKDPCKYHGVSPFNPEQGIESKTPKADATPTYTQVFSQWLCDMAEKDERLFGITPAMREGSGLVEFSKRFPERYHDVAIAEQHAVTLAAGLACEGMKPVVAIYSTFLQRAYDQLIHDVALQNLDVLFAIDRAGLVGPDGPTHAGSFDLSYLRCIPNMLIMTPTNEDECRQMLYTGYRYEGAAAVRYPRGKGTGVQPQSTLHALEIGRGEIVRQGKQIALLVFGAPLAAAQKVAENLSTSLANMRFVKPLDGALIKTLAAKHDYLVTIEENAIAGGAGSAVNEYLLQQGIVMPVLNLGLPDAYQDHGRREELLAECGLDAQGIEKAIKDFIHS